MRLSCLAKPNEDQIGSLTQLTEQVSQKTEISVGREAGEIPVDWMNKFATAAAALGPTYKVTAQLGFLG